MKWTVNINGENKTIADSDFVSVFYNLSDLVDKEEALYNLGLYDIFANVDDFKKTIIQADAIKRDRNKQFVTENDKEVFNGKINNPVIVNDTLDNTDLRDVYYNTKTKRFYIKVGQQFKLLGGRIRLYSTGEDYFSGANKETKIAHNLSDSHNIGVKPSYVMVIPEYNKNNGSVGDYWVKKDNNFIYVGNTGAANIKFQYMIFAPEQIG